MLHLKFMCKRYRYQVRRGRDFLHENPRCSRSWSQDCIRRLLKRSDVNVALCHQCQFGAESRTDDGGSKLILKPARFMSNSLYMLKELGKQCSRQHPHHELLGGRAAAAAFYPHRLLTAMLRGTARTTEAMHTVQALFQGEYGTQLLTSLQGRASPRS